MSGASDPTALHPEVHRVLHRLGLPVKHVLQTGPRYAVVSTEFEGHYAIFKMVIPGAANPPRPEAQDPLQLIPLHRILHKEIRLLEALDSWRGQIDGLTPHLYRYSTDPSASWYLRELYRGKPLGDSNWPFRFDPRFYAEVTPEAMMNYFASLHRISPGMAAHLTDLFAAKWPYELYTRQLAEVLGEAYNHPYIREHSLVIGEFLMRVQSEVAGERNVLTHHEPFGPHIFVADGKIGLIDWEQAALGHRLHDLAIIWTRAFENPAWQRQLTQLLEERGYMTADSRPVWQMLVLVQCIANYNHFQFSPHPDEAYQRALNEFLIGTVRSIVPELIL